MTKKLLKYAFLFAFGEIGYILLVAFFFQNGNKIFTGKDTILAPITMLLLLVISASVSGALVLGRPILMYLDGEKKDAVKLFGLTLAWMVIFLIILFLIVAIK